MIRVIQTICSIICMLVAVAISGIWIVAFCVACMGAKTEFWGFSLIIPLLLSMIPVFWVVYWLTKTSMLLWSKEALIYAVGLGLVLFGCWRAVVVVKGGAPDMFWHKDAQAIFKRLDALPKDKIVEYEREHGSVERAWLMYRYAQNLGIDDAIMKATQNEASIMAVSWFLGLLFLYDALRKETSGIPQTRSALLVAVATVVILLIAATAALCVSYAASHKLMPPYPWVQEKPFPDWMK